MMDSGLHSATCCVQFAKDHETYYSKRAKLLDIQDQQVEAHGKKIVDVCFLGKWMCQMSLETLSETAESWFRLALHEFRSHLLDAEWPSRKRR